MIRKRSQIWAAAAALVFVLSGCGVSEPPGARWPGTDDEVTADGEGPTNDEEPTEDEVPTGDEVPTEGEMPTGDRNPGQGDYTVSGHTLDRDGRPLANVDINIIIVPRAFGALYQTRSDSRGRYSYRVPGGVYNVVAGYDDPDDGDPVGLNMVVVETGELSAPITVPPGQVIDFQLA